MGKESENQANDVLNRMVNLSVKDYKIEEEFEKEYGSRLRLAKGALLIQEIGNRVHCSVITITKAMVLFHKVKKHPQLNGTCLASVACLNLSIKYSEDDVYPDEIVIKSYHTILDLENTPNPTRPDPSADELNDMKRNLYLAEYTIGKAMSFQLDCRVAHMYVYKFLMQLRSASDANEGIIVAMSSITTKLLSTYYMCEGCLNYTSDEIAWACLQFVYLYCGTVSSSVKYLLRKEVASVPNKGQVCQIVDEMVLVSDVATTLKYI